MGLLILALGQKTGMELAGINFPVLYSFQRWYIIVKSSFKICKVLLKYSV